MTTIEAKAIISKELKANGIKHRIAQFNGNRIRVVVEKERQEVGDTVEQIANRNGFTSANGKAVTWSSWNGRHEVTMYLPGAIVRI